MNPLRRVGCWCSSFPKTDFFRLFKVSLIIIFICTLSNGKPVSASEEPQTDPGAFITKTLNAFFAPEYGYDKRVRPNYGGAPVNVAVSMFLISISTVSEVNMDFTTDFYFRQGWKDPRLAFKVPLPGIENLYVGAEVADKIWVPDTFFANEKSAYFHKATTFNTFLRLGHLGDVFRSIRLTVTASCPMNLQYFPMDSQLCSIEIESYGYSMSDIIYTWGKGNASVGLDNRLSLPQFKVVGHRQQTKIESLSTGNYSRLVAEIQFTRSLGFYLIQIYIPASLIVVISWVSFWLHRNATPARVSLGVTTVLTMTTLMSSTNSQLPKISYVKSIDVFLGTCFVMVFASLLEYATVGYLGKRIAMRKSRAEQLQKLQEEQKKKLQAANQQQQTLLPQNHYCPNPLTQQPTILPPPPLMGTESDPSTEREEIPPPIPPAPVGIINPMICPFSTGSPRQIGFYQPGYGRTSGLPPPPCPPPGHYDRFGPPPPLSSSCQVRTYTPTHQPPTSGPGSQGQQQQLQQQQSTQQQQLKSGSEPRKPIIRQEPRRKDQPSVGVTIGPSPVVKSMTGKSFFSGGVSRKSKPNPNKLLGVGPSDIDKYSRVIFPVCFICFNLMYWIIYSHISDVTEQIKDLTLFVPAA